MWPGELDKRYTRIVVIAVTRSTEGGQKIEARPTLANGKGENENDPYQNFTVAFSHRRDMKLFVNMILSRATVLRRDSLRWPRCISGG
jgi:hypothetical protein